MNVVEILKPSVGDNGFTSGVQTRHLQAKTHAIS